VGWRVTRTRVTAPSQASRRHASGSSGPGPPISPPRVPGVTEEAVQVHGHHQLRADPTRLRQPTPPGCGGPTRPTHQRCVGRRFGCPGLVGAGQRFQGGQQGLAGLGFQQPIHCHHPLEGRGQPEPPAGMTLLGVVILAVGVGDQPQMARTRRSRGGSTGRPPRPAPPRLRQSPAQRGLGFRGPAPGHGRPRSPHQPERQRSRPTDPETAPEPSGPSWPQPPPPGVSGAAASLRSTQPPPRPRPRPRLGHPPPPVP